MSKNEWQRRAERAWQLASQYPAAAEMLRFYAAVAELQRDLWQPLEARAKTNWSFARPLPDSWLARFAPFLSAVGKCGPPQTAHAADDLRRQDDPSRLALLNAFWQTAEGAVEPGASDFLVRAFLQPFAAFVRSQVPSHPTGPTPLLCPFCGRKPVLGALRPQGDGGLRSLICSFCLGEWEFRRILCAACGEENNARLPVYSAEEFPHVRVECCDTCRCYIKTVDLTKNGLADPAVDELAAIPLDLWAQQQGYSKLHRNLMQI